MESETLQSTPIEALAKLSAADAAVAVAQAFSDSIDVERQGIPESLVPALTALALTSIGKYVGMLIELRKNKGRSDIALVLARFLRTQAPKDDKATAAYGWILASVLQEAVRGKGSSVESGSSLEDRSRVARLADETARFFLGDDGIHAFGVVREAGISDSSDQGAFSLTKFARSEPGLTRFAAAALSAAQCSDVALALLRALYDLGLSDGEWLRDYGWTVERAIRERLTESDREVADANHKNVAALVDDVVHRLLFVGEGMSPLTISDLTPPHSKETLARLSKVIVGTPERVRWTGRLLRSAKRYAESLELLRVLYRNDDMSDETAVEYGWALMAAIRDRDAAASQAEGAAASVALEEAKKITEEASKLRLPQTEEGQRLGEYLRHYMVKHMETEKHLADAYRELRSRHTKAPDDPEILVQFGWTLHDCIDQSVNRLRDRRLVKLFRDELAVLVFPETVAAEGTVTDPRAKAFERQFAKLRSCQPRDIALADEFLKGLGEIRVVSREGNHAAAIAMAKRHLELNPGSVETKALLAREHTAIGDHQNAIQWWRECVEADPGNETHQKGLMWAIVEGIKTLTGNPESASKAYSVRDLVDLTQTFPVALRAGVASECHKIGALDRAFILWLPILDEEPENVGYQTSLAWDIVRRLKELAAKACNLPKRFDKIVTLVDLTVRLPGIEHPSILSSLLLRRVTDACNAGFTEANGTTQRALADKYLEFVKRWDLRHLQEADLLPFEPEPGKSYPSLCEKVISALYAAAKKTESAEAAGWIADFMRLHLERYPNQEWFPYYYGKILVWAKRHADAREYLNQMARRKSSEFWTWSALADTYPDDRDLRIACICRALQCNVRDEGYLVNLHHQLGDELRAVGMDSAARFEYDRSDAIRKERKWGFGFQTPEFSAWREKTEPTPNNDRLYRELGAKAESMALRSLPQMKGNLEVRFHDRKKDRDVAVVGWDENGVYKTGTVPLARFPQLEAFPRGAPLWVRVEAMPDRNVICQIEQRLEGNLWDTYPMKPGVVVDVDPTRGLSKVAIGYEQFCLIDHANHPESRSWPPGTILSVGLPRERPVGGFPGVLVATEMTGTPPVDFIVAFHGDLKRNDKKGFGFVGDVFVPSHLVNQLPKSAQQVSGIALRGLNRMKNIPSWRALAVLPATP